MEVPFFVLSTGCREVRTGIRSKQRVRGKRRNRKVRRAVAFEDRLKWKKMRKIIELFDDYLLGLFSNINSSAVRCWSIEL